MCVVCVCVCVCVHVWWKAVSWVKQPTIEPTQHSLGTYTVTDSGPLANSGLRSISPDPSASVHLHLLPDTKLQATAELICTWVHWNTTATSTELNIILPTKTSIFNDIQNHGDMHKVVFSHFHIYNSIICSPISCDHTMYMASNRFPVPQVQSWKHVFPETL